LLNVLIGSIDFEDDLRNILYNYPRVLSVLPLLVALRESRFLLIDEFSEANLNTVEYDFTPRQLSQNEVDRIVQFCVQTGLKEFFQKQLRQNLQDYLFGVEVGLDTHARKNRSGDAMEALLTPLIRAINEELSRPFVILEQSSFAILAERYGIPVASSLKDRKADWILVQPDDRSVINIEANFYSGTGSKPQEIVDSYITRFHDLRDHSFAFIWITDGEGWRGQQNQIRKGFREIDFLFNLSMVQKGLLREVLCKCKI
ncbi:MAG: type II restriction endonuclease, partial [Atribacterota bacterium]|nr:type II restriction endonuclease [Atribacterota bacterium]